MKKSIKILNSCLDYGDSYSQFTFEGAIRISKNELKIVDFEEMKNGYCEINIPETPNFKWVNNWLTDLLKTAIISGEI